MAEIKKEPSSPHRSPTFPSSDRDLQRSIERLRDENIRLRRMVTRMMLQTEEKKPTTLPGRRGRR